MIINHNINAMNAHRNMGSTTIAQGKAMEKLNSGLRINRAADDAAGFAISEKMRSQIRGLNQASRNTQDGISMIQTAEGALSETQAIAQRMRELAVQSANGTYTDEDRTLIDQEFNQLKSEIDRIATDTDFSGSKVLNGEKSGEKIEFDKNGEWKEIDCKFSAVPDILVPQQIQDHIKKQFPQNKIIQIEKDSKGYEIKLNNKLELKYTPTFQLKEIDD